MGPFGDELVLGPRVRDSFFIRENLDGTRSIFRWSEPEVQLGKIEENDGYVTVYSNANNGAYCLFKPWDELLHTPQGIYAALDRADLNSPYYL